MKVVFFLTKWTLLAKNDSKLSLKKKRNKTQFRTKLKKICIAITLKRKTIICFVFISSSIPESVPNSPQTTTKEGFFERKQKRCSKFVCYFFYALHSIRIPFFSTTTMRLTLLVYCFFLQNKLASVFHCFKNCRLPCFCVYRSINILYSGSDVILFYLVQAEKSPFSNFFPRI